MERSALDTDPDHLHLIGLSSMQPLRNSGRSLPGPRGSSGTNTALNKVPPTPLLCKSKSSDMKDALEDRSKNTHSSYRVQQEYMVVNEG